MISLWTTPRSGVSELVFDTSVQCVDELVDPRTTVDDCLRYEIERSGPQYENRLQYQSVSRPQYELPSDGIKKR